MRSVGVAQESGPPQSPELRVFLHCAFEVDHEDDVAIGSRRVLVAGALERTMSAEHLPFYLDLAKIVIIQSITLCCWSFRYLKQKDSQIRSNYAVVVAILRRGYGTTGKNILLELQL